MDKDFIIKKIANANLQDSKAFTRNKQTVQLHQPNGSF
jgi:hypothetical protein